MVKTEGLTKIVKIGIIIYYLNIMDTKKIQQLSQRTGYGFDTDKLQAAEKAQAEGRPLDPDQQIEMEIFLSLQERVAEIIGGSTDVDKISFKTKDKIKATARELFHPPREKINEESDKIVRCKVENVELSTEQQELCLELYPYFEKTYRDLGKLIETYSKYYDQNITQHFERFNPNQEPRLTIENYKEIETLLQRHRRSADDGQKHQIQLIMDHLIPVLWLQQIYDAMIEQSFRPVIDKIQRYCKAGNRDSSVRNASRILANAQSNQSLDESPLSQFAKKLETQKPLHHKVEHLQKDLQEIVAEGKKIIVVFDEATVAQEVTTLANSEWGIKAGYFDANQKSKRKGFILNKFRSGEYQVIFATTAIAGDETYFGCADYVISYSPAKNLNDESRAKRMVADHGEYRVLVAPGENQKLKQLARAKKPQEKAVSIAEKLEAHSKKEIFLKDLIDNAPLYLNQRIYEQFYLATVKGPDSLRPGKYVISCGIWDKTELIYLNIYFNNAESAEKAKERLKKLMNQVVFIGATFKSFKNYLLYFSIGSEAEQNGEGIMALEKQPDDLSVFSAPKQSKGPDRIYLKEDHNGHRIIRTKEFIPATQPKQQYNKVNKRHSPRPPADNSQQLDLFNKGK
jgi:hypothetical protein